MDVDVPRLTGKDLHGLTRIGDEHALDVGEIVVARNVLGPRDGDVEPPAPIVSTHGHDDAPTIAVLEGSLAVQVRKMRWDRELDPGMERQ